MSRAADRPFKTLAVIGAGNMGSGIAQKMATEGFPVILVDLDDAKVARGIGILEETLKQGGAEDIPARGRRGDPRADPGNLELGRPERRRPRRRGGGFT